MCAKCQKDDCPGPPKDAITAFELASEQISNLRLLDSVPVIHIPDEVNAPPSFLAEGWTRYAVLMEILPGKDFQNLIGGVFIGSLIIEWDGEGGELKTVMQPLIPFRPGSWDQAKLEWTEIKSGIALANLEGSLKKS